LFKKEVKEKYFIERVDACGKEGLRQRPAQWSGRKGRRGIRKTKKGRNNGVLRSAKLRDGIRTEKGQTIRGGKT